MNIVNDQEINLLIEQLAHDGCLKQIIELTIHMFDAAKQEKWEELESCEAERQKLIVNISSLSCNDPLIIKQTIQTILLIDQQIINICQNNQRLLADKIQSLRIGEKARRAYESI